MKKVNNVSLNYKIVGKRKGDVEKIYADVSKVNRELKWKAKISLAESLQNAWNWQKHLCKK